MTSTLTYKAESDRLQLSTDYYLITTYNCKLHLYNHFEGNVSFKQLRNLSVLPYSGPKLLIIFRGTFCAESDVLRFKSKLKSFLMTRDEDFVDIDVVIVINCEYCCCSVCP